MVVAAVLALTGVVVALRADGYPAIDATAPRATRWFVDDANGRAVLAEWTSAHSYAVRVQNLAQGGGLNGGILLNDATVLDDGARDVLTGNGGLDWFLYNQDGPCDTRDVATDDHPNEVSTDIDIWS